MLMTWTHLLGEAAIKLAANLITHGGWRPLGIIYLITTG